MARNKIEDLRDHLFATLEALQDAENPMEVDRAKAISEVAGKLIDSGKLEVQFLDVVGGVKGTDFIPDAPRSLTHDRLKLVNGGGER